MSGGSDFQRVFHMEETAVSCAQTWQRRQKVEDKKWPSAVHAVGGSKGKTT